MMVRSLFVFIFRCEFNVDYLSSAVQFINIFVHGVDELCYRVHLQYEMTAMGFDDFVEVHLQSLDSEKSVDPQGTVT